jgi:penicillin-binding protein 2
MTLSTLRATLAEEQPVATPRPDEADVPFDLVFTTTRFGELRRRNVVPLVWEDTQWRVAWTPSVMLPELTGGRLVRAFSDPTTRGTILDRQGQPLAMTQPPTGGAPKGSRRYPAGTVAGPLIGHTGEVSDDDLKQLAGKGLLPGDEIGKAGVEAAAETTLGGQRGARLTVLAPSGEVASTLSAVPAKAGENLILTLDTNLQREAEAALGNRPGSIVVLDPVDGAIRALATYPRYDPNAFVTGEGVAAILGDAARPLVNRPVQGLYPPGSIFKVVTMAAALEHGAFQPDSTFTCTGRWTGLPGVSQNCWLATGHGHIDLVSGLTQSCDVVFYEVGKRLDEINPDLLPAMAKRCGLGAPTGALPGNEAGGIVPGPAWKPQTLNESWTRGDTVNMAIGQGHLLVTPLQMATIYAAIAGGGKLRGPRLLDRSGLPGSNVERLLSSVRDLNFGWAPATLDAMRTGLKNVVGAANGTANFVFRDSPLVSIAAGKTGTAESAPGRTSHAWFACFAPFDRPKAVVLVMLEYAGEGSQVAAPAARGLLEVALR